MIKLKNKILDSKSFTIVLFFLLFFFEISVKKIVLKEFAIMGYKLPKIWIRIDK